MRIRNERGMTLIEIMIVLAILGGLAALLGNQVIGALDKSKVSQAKTQIKEIEKKLDMYNLDCNGYPTSDQGLAALVKQPESGCPNWGPEPYYKKEPVDPWGNKFEYESDGTQFKLITYGKDKKPGGDKYAKDISSEDLN